MPAAAQNRTARRRNARFSRAAARACGITSSSFSANTRSVSKFAAPPSR